jgi:iodotyrosine deiodinase
VTCSPEHRTVPAPHRDVPRDRALAASRRFLEEMSSRRSIRDFSQRPVDHELVVNAIRTAATAPSGANRQPWRFVVITDPETKRRIREGAEAEERAFYEGPHTEWHDALAPLGTDWRKPMLEDAPALIAVFEVHAGNRDPKPYYAKESVGIAVGLLLASLHQAGLATLTHTPSPMGFLNDILGRPAHERPFVIIPVGHPAGDAQVPDIGRKPLDEVLVWEGPRDVGTGD